MIFKKKQLEWTLEVGFFSTLVIFVFHGAPLGHVSGHVACATWMFSKWKRKVLESWYAEAPKFWKSDQNWGSYGLDNQNHHYTSPFRSYSDQRWCLHWVFWKILIVMAITPSILVWFSKFWCLNPSAFQDLSFSFSDQPRGTCPRGQKRVLKLVHVN